MENPTSRRRCAIRSWRLVLCADVAARSLAGAHAFIIGLLIDNPGPNYTIKVQRGAYRSCLERGYHLRIDHLDSKLEDEEIDRRLAAMLQVNASTFQDQPTQAHSYANGSLSSQDAGARRQAIEHNIECIEIGRQLGSTDPTEAVLPQGQQE
ncbi:hypothetical protein POM99_02145 [Novosphingobium sp. HBC54]|uniref:Uncharacterized protein n=1 Tax=Novosphingobium cyanobacteriorum TaxID=3024215 RepID=A0ABT6CDI1_9SPHN|nr:hypothetical protein [Novosphingobium cyanobacteriorum]